MVNIGRLYKRLYHKQNSKKVFEFHNKNGTVPEKLDINRFPRPFLSRDTIFVDKYNSLIKDFQAQIMKLCDERLDQQIVKINDSIKVSKEKIPNMENEIKGIEDKVRINYQENLKKSLEKASYKARKVKES